MDRERSERYRRLFPQLREVPARILRETWEIRARAFAPLRLYGAYGSIVLPGGSVTPEALQAALGILSGHALYAHEEELRRGYLIAEGGDRAGICGTAVFREGKLASVRAISSINLRLAHEITGIADPFFEAAPGGILIAGPPGSGKTTLLRDFARLLSQNGKKVVLIDERGELAAMREGVPGFAFAADCDVLTGYPKAEGILCAVRNLSPEFILCDEIGSAGEAQSVSKALLSGAATVASVHLESPEAVFRRRTSLRLMRSGAFRSLIFLKDRKPTLYREEALYEMDRGGSDRPLVLGGRSA